MVAMDRPRSVTVSLAPDRTRFKCRLQMRLQFPDANSIHVAVSVR